LAGIRDAINQAALDVTASIVGDGSATPYRLVLQSSATGASSAMRISVAGDPALQALLGYDASGTQNLTQTVVAQDASLTINGVAVTSASNSVSSALDGVTLNLLKPGSSALTVGQDTSAAQNAVQAFVKAYNDLSSTLSDLSKYDPTTKQAGLLNGDSAVRSIQVQLRNVLGSALGTSLSYSTLSQLGLSFQRDGSLSLDTTKLQSALASDADSVAALFTTFGNTTDSLVHYVGQGDTTPPGQYNVSVSALATQGTLVGSTAAGLSIDASNDQIAVNLDGLTATIQLPDGTYTSDQLATLLQSAINGAATFRDAGSSVTVAQSGGVLSISSARYGSASQVSIGGASAASLLGGAPVATAGTDVAGTIDGSAGSGSGQTLTSATGLKIAISGGATGSRGSVTVTRGIATQLNTLLTQLLGSTGPISAETDGINRSIQDIDSRRDTLNQRLTDIEQRYRTQFTQLDTLLSNMTATSNFLTQQLAALNKSNG
jgi:flagellar hook-associated protein 2